MIRYAQDEEFRQGVIRKAILLGFSCEKYNYTATGITRYRFTCTRWEAIGPQTFDNYASIYSAAYDFMRFNNWIHLV